jgi:hypothetical protein
MAISSKKEKAAQRAALFSVGFFQCSTGRVKPAAINVGVRDSSAARRLEVENCL